MFDNPIQGNNSCAGSSNNINVNVGESIIPSDSTDESETSNIE